MNIPFTHFECSFHEHCSKAAFTCYGKYLFRNQNLCEKEYKLLPLYSIYCSFQLNTAVNYMNRYVFMSFVKFR